MLYCIKTTAHFVDCQTGLVQTRGDHRPAKKIKKKNLTESMFRREAESVLSSVFYPRIAFIIPHLIQDSPELGIE